LSQSQQQLTGLHTLSRAARGDAHVVPVPRFRWMTRVLLPGGILLGIALLLLVSAGQSLTPAIEVSAASVIERETTSARPGSSVVQAAGWIEADPYLTYVTALTDGVIAEVLVLEGDRVDAGQVVARLVGDDARLELQSAAAEAANREAMLLEARARLDAAQTEWDNPVEPRRAVDVAEAGLAESRALRTQIHAEIRSAEADLERLRSEHDRIASLGESRVVSDSELVNTRKRMEAQQATVEALHARAMVVEAQILRHESELRAAGEHLRLRTRDRQELETAKSAVARAEAELQAARVAVATAQLRVDRLEIKAGTAGVIVQRFAEPGGKVLLDSDDKHSAAIVSLYDPARLQVRVDVPLADAGNIAIDQPAEIAVEVLPNHTFTGRVSRILHVADIQKNTLQAKVTIDDPGALLRPEMLARVRFLEMMQANEIAQPTTALYVPRGAVNANAIWIVEKYDGTHGVAASRPVQHAGMERDGWIEIHEGLRPGDIVVTSPPSTLKPGSRLRVAMAAH
jgi:HlyD family secretion protein